MVCSFYLGNMDFVVLGLIDQLVSRLESRLLSTAIELVSRTRLSIPYRTGLNILYRPAIRYTRPPYFVPEKIPAVPANFEQYQLVQKKVFFFFFKFCNFLIFSKISISKHRFNPRLSIPYRTNQYGRNIPYQPAIRYV